MPYLIYEWTTRTDWGLMVEELKTFKAAQKSDKEMVRRLNLIEKENPRRRLYNLTNALKNTHNYIEKDPRFRVKKEGLRKALEGLETVTLDMFK